MYTKPTRLFTLTFVAISLLEMIGDTQSIQWIHYGCKPLIMLLLLGYSWQQNRTTGFSATVRWLMIGMVFALLGDIFLMIREVDLFAPGLGAFLLMQLCYCRSFWLSIHVSGQSIYPRSFLLTAIPFILYDSIFLFLLKPKFFQNPALTPLWWPVVGYIFCLSTMGILAFQRRGLARYSWVAIGAILFILSDSAIAIDKFLQPIMGATWFIMSTYAVAQYMIVTGTLDHEQSIIRLHKPDGQHI
ncbi:lysoplasmalogenase [Spirosoma sp. HMF4905]|uniref:Lysoplasmalogenase n=1 Tax=Spirosoma arboris TaxID=2682092 RepID=A0A7K1S4G8_9BACT|nr:lysoplasmalogenase [Spirosoma arboris]MVM28615.1 lysoplasmalogenase [Spirosoma arboris]